MAEWSDNSCDTVSAPDWVNLQAQMSPFVSIIFPFMYTSDICFPLTFLLVTCNHSWWDGAVLTGHRRKEGSGPGGLNGASGAQREANAAWLPQELLSGTQQLNSE